jgi:hypothetical protein
LPHILSCFDHIFPINPELIKKGKEVHISLQDPTSPESLKFLKENLSLDLIEVYFACVDLFIDANLIEDASVNEDETMTAFQTEKKENYVLVDKLGVSSSDDAKKEHEDISSSTISNASGNVGNIGNTKAKKSTTSVDEEFEDF